MSAAKHYLGIVWLLAFAASASAAPRAWLDRTQINEGDTVTLNIESESSDTPDFSVLESDFDLRGQSSQTQTTNSNGSVTTRTLWADRKSVVEGKSVPVRVDLGGRRIIKNNRQYIYHHIIFKFIPTSNTVLYLSYLQSNFRYKQHPT